MGRNGPSDRYGDIADKSRASDAVTQPRIPTFRLQNSYPSGSKTARQNAIDHVPGVLERKRVLIQ